MEDEQGAGEKSGMGIVSSTFMIERREQLDYGLAPLLSSLPSVTRMVTRKGIKIPYVRLLICKPLFILVGRVGLEPTTY
jgi:hypothetical protein